MAITGESKNSIEGAPKKKIYEEWKLNLHLLGYKTAILMQNKLEPQQNN